MLVKWITLLTPYTMYTSLAIVIIYGQSKHVFQFKNVCPVKEWQLSIASCFEMSLLNVTESQTK